MDSYTPPTTPPAHEDGYTDSLQVHYWDFAYPNKGPYRMPVAEVQDTTAKTFAELLSGPVMDIYVGKSKRRWSLHKNLLSYHTSWFQDKIKQGVHEKGGSLEFFDDDPRAFELLVKWLYQGKIDNVSDMPFDKKWDYADSCQQLYVLCERIRLPELKNAAIDQFRKGCYEAGLVPGPEEMKPIYERTGVSSPFRKLVSRIAARQIMDPYSGNDASKYRDCFAATPDFAIDVVNAIKENMGGLLFDDPTSEDGCHYHEHHPGQRCNQESLDRDAVG